MFSLFFLFASLEISFLSSCPRGGIMPGFPGLPFERFFSSQRDHLGTFCYAACDFRQEGGRMPRGTMKTGVTREIPGLRSPGCSLREICRSVKASAGSVGALRRRAGGADLRWPVELLSFSKKFLYQLHYYLYGCIS